MTGAQQSNVRITRARAAKSASIDAVSLEKQLPLPVPAGQRKCRKRPASEEPKAYAFEAGTGPAKRRAVLGDVTNVSREEVSVDCLARAKQHKSVSQANSGKGRGQTISQSANKDTSYAEAKENIILAPCNAAVDFASNSVGVDKENREGKNTEVVKGNPKDFTTVVQPVPANVQCKEAAAQTHAEKIAVNAKVVVVPPLKQQPCQNVHILREPKSSVKQGIPPLPLKPHANPGQRSRSHYIDIDSDHKDPQMCTAYATDIYDNLRIIELKRRPSPNYIEVVQQEINANMRGILIDWLVEVAEEYKLVPDTLYLTVSYIDRFLSANVVTRQKLQLLGITCMLVASKYEEMSAPTVDEFCYITDNTYTREEVLEMEIDVLNHLRYDLTTPTTKSFLRRFIRAAQTSFKVPSLHLEFMGNYLAELTLVEYDFLRYLPSMIAASAVFVAKMTIDPITCPWNSTLQHYTGFKVSELKDCIQALHDLQLNKKGCVLSAIREKYGQHKFKSVADLSPPSVISSHFLEDIEVTL